MVEVTVLKRFPFGGKYRQSGDVVLMPEKLAKVLVLAGRAEYFEYEQEEFEPDAVDKAKELAEENGVDLREVEGTGKDGKILKRDVSSYLTRVMKPE